MNKWTFFVFVTAIVMFGITIPVADLPYLTSAQNMTGKNATNGNSTENLTISERGAYSDYGGGD